MFLMPSNVLCRSILVIALVNPEKSCRHRPETLTLSR